ncbi:putative MFS family arabinose efflux permease [Nonomuraea polychroma]|uniref:Putative MFS family arabinose efflux permease n=2 Tax=Nonomuraea polychroma TaxID=46176 RepID=A0A438M4U3_9ACTN|nr:putative MFS family arabinose efflux permease [Nonomuraea polychroma]
MIARGEADARVTGRRRALVPLLVVTGLVVLIQLYVSIPLQQPVAADLGDAGVTAALASGYALCYAAGFLVYGPLSDHFGRRPLLVIGLATLTIATLGVGLAPSLSVLGVLRAVQGAAAATFAPTALAFLGEALPQGRRTSAIGAMSVAFLAAGIIGQLGAAGIGETVGWRWTFYLSGAILGCLTLATFALVDEPTVERPPQRLLARYAALLRFALRPRSIVLSAGHLVVLGGFVGMYTLLGPHLTAAGLTATEIMAVRGLALPAMCCSLLLGPLVSQLGPVRTVLTGFSIAAAGLLNEAALSHSLVGLTAASIGFVAGIAVLVPLMITLWGQAAPPTRGIGMAINGFVLFLGAGLGPYATLLPGDFAWALTIIAALYLVAAALVVVAIRQRPGTS